MGYLMLDFCLSALSLLNEGTSWTPCHLLELNSGRTVSSLFKFKTIYLDGIC